MQNFVETPIGSLDNQTVERTDNMQLRQLHSNGYIAFVHKENVEKCILDEGRDRHCKPDLRLFQVWAIDIHNSATVF